MTHKPVIICVEVHPRQEWFIATSSNLENFILTYPDLPKLLADIPEALKVFYKHQFQMDVNVTPAAYAPGETALMPLRYSMQAA